MAKMTLSDEHIYWRYKWTTFFTMYAGYTLLILNRKSFSFALPAIMQEGFLDKDDLGMMLALILFYANVILIPMLTTTFGAKIYYFFLICFFLCCRFNYQ